MISTYKRQIFTRLRVLLVVNSDGSITIYLCGLNFSCVVAQYVDRLVSAARDYVADCQVFFMNPQSLPSQKR